MSEPRILHLESATNVCSVAVSEGEKLLALRETEEDRSHGSVLTVFIDEVLNEAGLKSRDLNAISVSKGPGSYTGLRIGVSVTKGFAYALNIPVIGISTLKAITASAMNSDVIKELQVQNPELLFCPLIDARRMEVYTAVFSKDGTELEAVSAKIIDENSFSNFLLTGPVAFFGNGSNKITDIITNKNAHFIKDINPSASYMIPAAMEAYRNGIFENTAYFEPYYLKDFVATIPKKKVL